MNFPSRNGRPQNDIRTVGRRHGGQRLGAAQRNHRPAFFLAHGRAGWGRGRPRPGAGPFPAAAGRCASRCRTSWCRGSRSRVPWASRKCSRRATLPSRKQGVPATSPVKRPSISSGSVAIRCGMPNSFAIGPVTKLLVAVMTATRSASVRCLFDQFARGLGDHRPDARFHVFGAPGVELRARMGGERAQGKREEGVDIQRARPCSPRRRPCFWLRNARRRPRPWR